MTRLRAALRGLLTRAVVSFAHRLGFVLVRKADHASAVISLLALIRYAERSGFLNQDHKAKKRVLRSAGWAIKKLHPPAFEEAADVVLGTEAGPDDSVIELMLAHAELARLVS